MISKQEIEKQLVETKLEKFDEDFVAGAVVLKDGIANHGGLIISYAKKSYFLHFNGEKILFGNLILTDIPKIYHKNISLINPLLIPSFIVHCKLILETAKPRYGVFYNGSYYKDGIYFSDNDVPEFMTCVGFCISVLKGFIEENDYLAEGDWTTTSAKAEAYFENFIINFSKEFPSIEVETLRQSLRRIKPSEFIASGYFNNLPVRKIQTDQVKPVIEDIFKSSI